MNARTLLLLACLLPSCGKARAGEAETKTQPEKQGTIETQGATVKDLVLDTVIEVLRIGSGSLPKAVEITPDGRYAFTTNFGDGTIGKIAVGDTTWIYKKKRFDPGTKDLSLPVEMAFDSTRPWAYISDFSHARVRVMDWQADTFITDIKVGVLPKIVKVSPDGKRLWVSNWASNTVSVVSLDSMKEIAQIKVGAKAPRGIGLTSDGKRAYVADFDGSAVSVLDAESLRLIKVIKAPWLARHVAARNDTAFITIYGSGRLWIMTQDSVVANYTIGGRPKSIVLWGHYAFIANYGANRMDVFDLEKQRVAMRVPAGKSPSGIAITKDGQFVYMTNWFDPSLSVFKLIWKSPHQTK